MYLHLAPEQLLGLKESRFEHELLHCQHPTTSRLCCGPVPDLVTMRRMCAWPCHKLNQTEYSWRWLGRYAMAGVVLKR